MKKFAILVFIMSLAFTSCSLDDSPNNNFYLEVVGIDSVVVPEQFIFGETYEIFVTYTKENSCYSFSDFIYEINGQERTIAVVNTVYAADDSSCTGEPEEVTVHFNFYVYSTDTYLFKFYQGEDDEGEDQFLLVEVPVVEE